MRLYFIICINFLLLSCSNQDSNKNNSSSDEIINPNGNSELALAMRNIFSQTEDIKKSLIEGKLEIPEGYITTLKSFHTAIPTDSTVKVEEFFGFVNAIEIAAKNLTETIEIEEQKKNYSRVINSCVQCHQQFCPGPIRRINKLKLPA